LSALTEIHLPIYAGMLRAREVKSRNSVSLSSTSVEKHTQHRRRPSFARIWRFRLLAFFAVFGPGFITANVDNDVGGILTYSQAGAKFGYALLWTLIPTTIALIVVQEMAARMGAVTGKGLHDLIRQQFGIRATFF